MNSFAFQTIEKSIESSNKYYYKTVLSLERFNSHIRVLDRIKTAYSIEDLDSEFIFSQESIKKVIKNIWVFLVESLQKLFLSVCNLVRSISNFISSQFMKLKISTYEKHKTEIEIAKSRFQTIMREMPVDDKYTTLFIKPPVDRFYAKYIRNKVFLKGIQSFLEASSTFLIPFQTIILNLQKARAGKPANLLHVVRLINTPFKKGLEQQILNSFSFGDKKIVSALKKKNNKRKNMLSWPTVISEMVTYGTMKPKKEKIRIDDFLIRKVPEEILSKDTLTWMDSFVTLTRKSVKVFSESLKYAKQAQALTDKINEDKLVLLNKLAFKAIRKALNALTEQGLLNRAYNNFLVNMSLHIYKIVLTFMNHSYHASMKLLKIYEDYREFEKNGKQR